MIDDVITEFFGAPIAVYTREQAIEDGQLVDVSTLAREAGLMCPVAITRAAYDEYVVPSARDAELGQDLTGRLWDVLVVLKVTARQGGQEIEFAPRMRLNGRLRVVWLRAVIGPGDTPEPVITIMKIDED